MRRYADESRADLNAKIIGTAAKLPVYDDTYSRLRTEYLEVSHRLLTWRGMS